MNGYTSVNAAITVHGHKKSLAAILPDGVFVDLDVLARAPKRLIQAGFGDAICRSTAQADWLLAGRLLGQPYRTTPFAFIADLENELVADPAALLKGDRSALSRLIQILLLSGFGMTICGGSYPASQGEHLISHHIEMMPPTGWEPALHGEQIAVTTLVMAKLQDRILSRDSPPQLGASKVSAAALRSHFGDEVGLACWKDIQPKLTDHERADAPERKTAGDLATPQERDRIGAPLRRPDRRGARQGRSAPLLFHDSACRATPSGMRSCMRGKSGTAIPSSILRPIPACSNRKD